MEKIINWITLIKVWGFDLDFGFRNVFRAIRFNEKISRWRYFFFVRQIDGKYHTKIHHIIAQFESRKKQKQIYTVYPASLVSPKHYLILIIDRFIIIIDRPFKIIFFTKSHYRLVYSLKKANGDESKTPLSLSFLYLSLFGKCLLAVYVVSRMRSRLVFSAMERRNLRTSHGINHFRQRRFLI